MPLWTGPTSNPLVNPGYRPTRRPTLAGLTPPSWKKPRLTEQRIATQMKLLANPAVLASPAIRRFRQLPLIHATTTLLCLTSAAFRVEQLARRPDPLGFDWLVHKLAASVPRAVIARFAADPDRAYRDLEAALARVIPVEAVWIGVMAPASDRALPERLAIAGGPEAMQAFVAGGGAFSSEPDALGQTDAHAAAMAAGAFPDAAAAFVALGGPFHDLPDRACITPSHYLVCCGQLAGVRAFLGAGGRLLNSTLPGGADLLDQARALDPCLADLVRDALEAP